MSNLELQLATLKAKREELEASSAGVMETAMREVSDKLEQVDKLLNDVIRIANLSGIDDLDVNGLFYKVESMREDFSSWNSSSYNC